MILQVIAAALVMIPFRLTLVLARILAGNHDLLYVFIRWITGSFFWERQYFKLQKSMLQHPRVREWTRKWAPQALRRIAAEMGDEQLLGELDMFQSEEGFAGFRKQNPHLGDFIELGFMPREAWKEAYENEKFLREHRRKHAKPSA